MPGRLSGKTAIVTGAGAGFGEGIAKKFVEEGANVLIWDINPSTAAKVAAALDTTGTQTLPFTGDVSNAADWDRALEEALRKWGALDVLVNNAGVVYPATPSIEVCPATEKKSLSSCYCGLGMWAATDERCSAGPRRGI